MENRVQAYYLLEKLLEKGTILKELELCFLNGDVNDNLINSVTIKSGNKLLSASYSNGTFTFSYRVQGFDIEDVVNSFKEYIQSVDDDIFIEACELFKVDNDNLTEFDKLLNERDPEYKDAIKLKIEEFIQCILQAAYNKVTSIVNKYGLGDKTLYISTEDIREDD